jgi:hypothetical protein
MSDFYADSRYYIDFSKIVYMEIGDNSINGSISITFLNGKTYIFYEDEDRDYKAFKALKAWQEKKIKETE